jgi:hypothetical protein
MYVSYWPMWTRTQNFQSQNQYLDAGASGEIELYAHLCWELTGVSNKLGVWVWHRPKPQKGASTIMPNKLHTWIGTASAAEVDNMQYSCFPKMFTFREKLSQVSPDPKDYNVTPPPARIASPPPVTTVYNKFTEGEGGWCVSIQSLSLPGPSFMHAWSSVCCLFMHLPSPPVRFIGQTCAGHETFANRFQDINSVNTFTNISI